MVLTVDVGSSSLRTNLYNGLAESVADCKAQVAYHARVVAGGGVEIDPDTLLEQIAGAIDRTLEGAGKRAGRVRGVGMCSLASNVLGIDSDGRPTTPIYTWADTRPWREAAELRRTLDEAAIHNRTGCPIHTSYLPARLLWLQHVAPEAYARTAHWITMGDWLQLRLFGKMGQSLSVASWGGLLNRETLDWDDVWLDYLKVGREKLPPLVDVADGMQGLRGEWAARWPSLKGVPWFPCVGDGVGSNIGSGCIEPGEVAVQVGTSGAVRAIVADPVESVPPGLWLYRVSREAALLGGALSEGGNLFAWLRDTLKAADWDKLEQEAAALPPDTHGLTILPFIAGERSPGWDADARATVSGLSLGTTPVDIMRAAEEAIAYRFGLVYSLLCAALPPVEIVVASGGALLHVPGWIGMLADVLGVPVTTSREEEASSKGVAMLALRSLGLLESFADVPAALGEMHSPDMSRHEVYREGMERQRRLYEAVKEL